METSKDSTLHALRHIISLGWPENRAHCPAHLMPFWNFRDELSVEDGLVLNGQRIIFHVQRQRSSGVVAIMTSIKWSNRVRHARHIIKNYQVANTTEKLISRDVPKRAWNTLATDLFHWNGMEYLLVADFYSKFPIMRTSALYSTIINHLT